MLGQLSSCIATFAERKTEYIQLCSAETTVYWCLIYQKWRDSYKFAVLLIGLKGDAKAEYQKARFDIISRRRRVLRRLPKPERSDSRAQGMLAA